MDKESGCKSSSNLLQSDFSRNASVFRVLVVEDHEPFRRCVCSILELRPELEIICTVSDGLEAVQKAEELRPDLILLDIGLPTLNGMEAARRIRRLSPESKILFLSQESSADVVEEAFRVGAMGYVTKVRVASELLNAVEAVCQGKRLSAIFQRGTIIATLRLRSILLQGERTRFPFAMRCNSTGMRYLFLRVGQLSSSPL